MKWNITADRPVYLQLIEQLELAIVAGEYRAGARLPGVREMAAGAAVNPNTMQRALQELEARGLLNTQRTAGRTVTEDKTMIAQLGEQLAAEQIGAFLQMMEGALSGKTGFTGTAGYCYVGALQREDKTLIVALLACGWPNNKTYKWSDTRKLMNYGLEQFKKINLLQIEPDEAELAPIEVRDGQGGQIGETVYLKPVVRNYAGEESILAPLSSEVTLKYEIADQLYAPVKSGDYIGKICYMLGEETLAERCVVAGETIGKIDYPWCLGQVLRLLWIE